MLRCRISSLLFEALADPQESMFEHRKTNHPTIPMLQTWGNSANLSSLELLCPIAHCSFSLDLQGGNNFCLHTPLEYTFWILTSLELILLQSCICHCMSSSQMASCSILHLLGTVLCCSSCTSLPPQGLHTWSHQSSVFHLLRGLLRCTASYVQL